MLKTNSALAEFNVTSKQLDQSQKVLLRTMLVLKNASNSFGDMQNTIDSLQNTIRVFQGSLANLRLALGDAIAEPVRRALVYINAFVIGITEIIRAFVPIKKESSTFRDTLMGVAEDSDEAADALDNLKKSGNLLDFDKFSVLSKKDTSANSYSRNLELNAALTAELEKQQKLYQEALDRVSKITNESVEIAKNIRSWFINVDADGRFESWTINAKLLATAIGAIIVPLTVSRFASLGKYISILIASLNTGSLAATGFSKSLALLTSPLGIIIAITGVLYATNKEFRDSINELGSALLSLMVTALKPFIKLFQSLMPILTTFVNILVKLLVPIINIVTEMVILLEKTGLLEVAMWGLVYVLGTIYTLKTIFKIIDLTSAFILMAQTLITKTIPAMWAFVVANASMLIGIAGFSIAFFGILKLLDDAPKPIRFVVGALLTLVGALVAGAAAWLAFHGTMSLGLAVPVILTAVGAGLAGLMSMVGSISDIKYFADGGFTPTTAGSLFMAGENGKQELMGNIGGRSAVANVDSIENAMYKAAKQGVFEGVLEAMSITNNGNGGNKTIHISLEVDGKTLVDTVQKYAPKQGLTLSKV